MKNAQAVAAKWAANLAASVGSIKDGVQGVTTSPTQKAAARADAYIAGVMEAVQSGKFAAKLNAVSLGDWQQAMINKGVPRIPGGAQAAKPKFEAFMQKWLAWEAQLTSILASMPRGTLQENIARAVVVIEHNAKFKA